MHVLLDTHALLWAIGAPDRLSTAAHDALLQPDHEIAFSTVCLWEIAIKLSLGRIELGPDWLAEIEQGRKNLAARWLSIEPAHCAPLATLPFHHRDPFDRMLVAQAMHEGMALMSKDSTLASYPVRILW